MGLIRSSVFYATAVLLGGGYLLSQRAFLESTTQDGALATVEHAARFDSPTVKYLSLLLFVAIVVIAFLPHKEKSD